MIGCVALLESIFSDVIEVDAKQSSLPISGAYFGLWKMATKIARALGLACSGVFLSLIGFVEGSAVQAAGVERLIAWAFGPGVALFFGMGAWFVFKFSQSFRTLNSGEAAVPHAAHPQSS